MEGRKLITDSYLGIQLKRGCASSVHRVAHTVGGFACFAAAAVTTGRLNISRSAQAHGMRSARVSGRHVEFNLLFEPPFNSLPFIARATELLFEWGGVPGKQGINWTHVDSTAL